MRVDEGLRAEVWEVGVGDHVDDAPDGVYKRAGVIQLQPDREHAGEGGERTGVVAFHVDP